MKNVADEPIVTGHVTNHLIARATRIGRNPRWRPVFALPAGLEPWLQQQQLAVTAVAAPTHFEGLRAEWVMKAWRAHGLAPELDEVGNVIALRPGSEAAAPAVCLSAHLDTAFAPGTKVAPERRGTRLWGPGISDNSSGQAALLAIMRMLQDARVGTRAPILFVANVGEEGEGDLKGMRHLFRSGGAWAERIGWTVVLDGPGCDQITSQALPSRRLRLVFTGPGGHSWSDLGRASAAHALVRAGAALLAQVRPLAGELGCNLGMLQGGSAINAIAATAECKLDLRAQRGPDVAGLDQAVRRALAQGVEQENQAALSGAVEGVIEVLGERPGGELPADAPLLKLVQHVDAELGIASAVQRASTDANIPIAQGRQALRLGAGGSGGGIHTLQEWYDPAGRALALQRILLVVLALAEAELPAPAAVAGKPRRRS